MKSKNLIENLSESGLIEISQLNWAKRLSRKNDEPNKTLGSIPTIVISLREDVDDGILKNNWNVE